MENQIKIIKGEIVLVYKCPTLGVHKIEGYCNGKNYNGCIYVSNKSYKSGLKVDINTIISLEPIKKAAPVKKLVAKTKDFGVCHYCDTYCYGDCQA